MKKLSFFIFLMLSVSSFSQTNNINKPNIVYILADDLG
jgi:hypothetical protein